MMRRAIFLDRDGVINYHVSNLSKEEQFEMFPYSPSAIKRINDAGYLAIIATNQPVIAKGFCTLEELERIHDKMLQAIRSAGARIDGLYVCPHHPEKGFPGEIPELKIDCECRKPKPGMLLQAAKEHDIDLASSWMIGDSVVDVAAGKAAGTKTVQIRSGGNSSKAERELIGKVFPDIYADNIEDAISKILGGHR